MTRNHALSLALFLSMGTPLALCQGPGPMPPPSSPPPPARSGQKGGEHRGPEGGLGIVPPGTWWKNPDTVTKLGLTADQQKKMDDIFLQNRITLIHMHASLEEEQLNLEPLLNANPVDSSKALAVISKVADLRADLEKADAKMLLSLRAVLTPDQWTKLQADMKSHQGNPPDRDRRGKGGPGRVGPGGPGGGLDEGPAGDQQL